MSLLIRLQDSVLQHSPSPRPPQLPPRALLPRYGCHDWTFVEHLVGDFCAIMDCIQRYLHVPTINNTTEPRTSAMDSFPCGYKLGKWITHQNVNRCTSFHRFPGDLPFGFTVQPDDKRRSMFF